MLSDRQITDFRRQLETRRSELVDDIRRELLKSDEAHYADLAGRVHDPGEESVADLLADLDHAEVDRDVRELREVELALSRISMGSYGRCVDCGADIEVERLQAYPAAQRCIDDQRRYEQTHAVSGRPTL